MAIAANPSDPETVLIGLESWGAFLWDFSKRKVVRWFEPMAGYPDLLCLSFSPDTKTIIACFKSQDYSCTKVGFWKMNKSNPCQEITDSLSFDVVKHVHWTGSNESPIIIFSGTLSDSGLSVVATAKPSSSNATASHFIPESCFTVHTIPSQGDILSVSIVSEDAQVTNGMFVLTGNAVNGIDAQVCFQK